MDCRLLRSEEDYHPALRQVEALLHFEPGTPDAGRLEILLMLAEAYEALHPSAPSPDPRGD
jgi:HTH-type transcriptional regulator/antitoxin HigA